MKKYILLILLFSLCVATCVQGADFVDIAKDAPYEKAIDVVCGFGITDAPENGKFDPKAEVSRGEFVEMVMRMVQNTSDAKEEIFHDVPLSSRYAAYVNAAYNAGYISRDESMCFYPDRAIDFAEADSILIRMLGYDMYAKSAGGYPYGYYSQANDKKLHKDIKSAINNKLTKGEAAQLLYNCLTVPVLEIGTFSGDTTEYVKGDTVSEKFLGIEVIYGRMTGNSITSLDSGIGHGKNEVSIEFESYRSDGKDYDSLLGFDVEAFVKIEDDMKYVVHMVKSENNDYLQMSASDYVGFNDGNVTYRDGERLKNKRISKRYYLLYNGEYYNAYNDDFWKNISGSVGLVDNNKDGEYDIIIVNNYEYYVVEKVNSADAVIYTDKIMLDLEKNVEDETIRIIDSVSDKVIDLGDIHSDTAISVMTGKKGTVTIYANNPVASGVLTEMDTETVTVGGISYRHIISQGKLQPGNNVKVYFNHLSEVVYVEYEKSNSSALKYGYILNLKTYEDDSVHLKILTDSGAMVVFDVADKVKIDGESVRYDDIDSVLKACAGEVGYGDTHSMLVKYRLNSKDQINYLDTPRYLKDIEDEESLIKEIDLKERTHYRRLTSSVNGNFSGIFNISSDAKVFIVPSSPEKRAKSNDEKLFGVDEIKYFATDSYYPVSGEQTLIEAYTLSDVYTTDVVVVYMADDATGSGDVEPRWVERGAYMLVEKVKDVWDEEEEELKKHIIGVSGGKSVELTVKDTIDEALINSLSSGDVIAYNFSFGEISTLKKVFNYDAEKNTGVIEYGSKTYTADDGVNYGELVTGDEGAFLMDVDEGIRCYIHTGDIYLFDSEEKTARLGDYTDVVGRDDTMTTGRYALVLMKWGIVCSVIVYK